LSIQFGEFDHSKDLSLQRELFENAFPEHKGKSPGSVAHYLWKFQGFPLTPPSYEYVATEGRRMLGYYAAIPYPYEIGNQRVTAGMVCDVMTHSEARGRGVFTKLGAFGLTGMEESNLDFVIGYPIRDEVMGGHLRVGWRVAFELPMYLKPLRADAILKSRHAGWLALPVNAGIAIYQAAFRRRRVTNEYDSVVGLPGDLLNSAEFDLFQREWSENVRNNLVKSSDFYNWRLSAPGTEYQVFLIYRKDAIVAAAICREASLYDVPSYALLDLMVLKGNERALPVIHRAIEDEARDRRVEAIATMMSRHNAREYHLIRSGFLRSPFTFKVILRSLSDEFAVEQVLEEKDWHLMWIDSDDL
jgi:hypothetical protein